MSPYEGEAAFATGPGSLAHGIPGVREALAGFISMKGDVLRLQQDGTWRFVIDNPWGTN